MEIDEFGAKVDELLTEKKIHLNITFQKGSLDPEFESNYQASPILNLYLLIRSMKKGLEDLLEFGIVDEDRKENVIDALMEMLKNDILDDGEESDE